MFASILLLAFLAATTAPDDIEIEASLSGYNLLGPSSRCCAFKLHIYPNGHETIVADIGTGDRPSEWTQEVTLTAEQLLHIRAVLRDADFSNLPSNLCCRGIDTDERHLSVRLGKNTRSFNIPDDVAIEAPLTLKQQLAQLRALWTVVTEQVRIPGANIK